MLDGDPAPPQKVGGAPSRIFGKFLLCPKGRMHDDATWYGGRPQPSGLCVRWGPSPKSPKRGWSSLPNFRPTGINVLLSGVRSSQAQCNAAYDGDYSSGISSGSSSGAASIHAVTSSDKRAKPAWRTRRPAVRPSVFVEQASVPATTVSR